MSKEIPLTQGQVAIVDDEDFERVNRIRWHLHSQGYAVGHDPDLYVPGQAHRALVLMHRYILGLKPGDKVTVDHRDHNRLDNRRRNLRVGTNAGNMMNRSRTIRPEFSSRFRGVAHRGGRSRDCHRINDRGYRAKMSKPWSARFKGRYIGVFAEEEEAAYCRDLVALREEGSSAQLNFPIQGLE